MERGLRPLSSLTDQELVEELLGFLRPVRDPHLLAADLFRHFGSLFGITAAYPEELSSLSGLERSAVTLYVAGVLAKRGIDSRRKGYVLSSPADAVNLLGPYLRASDREVHLALLLDDSLRFLDLVRAFKERDGAVARDAFPALVRAKELKAPNLILAGNRPVADRELEEILLMKDTLRMTHITLLDVLSVSPEGFVSLAESGVLPGDEPARALYLPRPEGGRSHG